MFKKSKMTFENENIFFRKMKKKIFNFEIHHF